MLAHSSIVVGSPPSPMPLSPRSVSMITTFEDWLTIGWPRFPDESPGFRK